MKNDNPVIPAGEYPQRWEKIQRLMEAHALDALLAYSDDRAAFGTAYSRWIADFPTHFEPVLILFTADQPPKLLCGPETDGYAALHSQIKDIVVLQEFCHPDEDYPYTKVTPLRDIAGGRIKKLGIAGMDLISFPVYMAIKNAFDCEITDVSKPVGMLRAVKSSAEIEVMRYAYRLAEKGLNAAIEAITPGITQREIAARAEAVMRAAGGEGMGIDTIVASGRDSRPILARAAMTQIEKDDIVTLTIAPRYQGYHGAIARPVVIGEPSDRLALSAIEWEAKAQEETAAALAAGVPGAQAEAVGRRIMAEAGMEKYYLYSGLHSIGVIEFEVPIFGPSSKDVLQEGMTVSIDIPVFEADFAGSRTEDGYLITSGGAEKMNHTPQLIRI